MIKSNIPHIVNKKWNVEYNVPYKPLKGYTVKFNNDIYYDNFDNVYSFITYTKELKDRWVKISGERDKYQVRFSEFGRYDICPITGLINKEYYCDDLDEAYEDCELFLNYKSDIKKEDII